MNASPFNSLSVSRTPEVARVAALPRRAWGDADAARLAELMTRELKTPAGTMALRPVQAVALYEAAECGGLFGPIRVGAGKTLVALLLSLVLEAKRPLLLLPASLIQKTWNERKVLAEHWRLPTNLQMCSYESLSLVQSAQKLEYIQPDLIVADEAHFLKGRRAGRTRRFVRYMDDHPDTKFACMSGTMMKSSIRDFAHLLRFALKEYAPIPVTDDEVEEWSEALDDHVNPLGRRRPEALLAFGEPRGDHGAELAGLLDTLQQDDLARARRAFQARLLDTRGVVASSKNDGVTCSIRVQALEYELSPVVEEHFKTLRARWETPCGKSFSEPAEMRMYARELALGFSYTWIPRERVAEWENLARKNSKRGVEPETGRDQSADERQILSFTSVGETLIGTNSRGTGRNVSKKTETLLENTKKSIGLYVEQNKLLTMLNGVKSTRKESKTGIEKESTEFLQKSGNVYTSLKGACAHSVRVRADIKDCASTTITLQGRSADFSVSGAMPQLEHLGTTPLGLNEPLRTFLEQNRPPQAWLSARRAWSSFVREQIAESSKYDTMLQVANACRAGLLDSGTLDAWKAVESSYEPATRPIFYDTAALETCLKWVEKNVGIVWVEHQAFGTVLSQLSGAPYFGAGGLDSSGASIAAVKGDQSVIASIAACGQGFNLQMFSKNLITSCPSGAATVEQVLGRTHRDGQLADEVVVDVLVACREQFDAFHQALDGARAAEDLLGHSQKLLLADVLMPDINNRRGPLWS